jgi:ubiquinone/menaquinone biosynthesis C-methylase UbiE
MLELYNQKVTANHLDVGVGTGYFLDNCKFPTASPRLALMDLNPDCLERAGKRVARYNPVKYQRNVLESVKIDVEKFDSIGMLHFTASPARRGRKGSSLRWENQYLPREDSR